MIEIGKCSNFSTVFWGKTLENLKSLFNVFQDQPKLMRPQVSRFKI